MTIERVDAWLFHCPLPAEFRPSWTPGIPSTQCSGTIFRLVTDDGLEGYAGGLLVAEEARGVVDLLRLYLAGREPTDIEAVLRILRTSTRVLGYRAWHIEPALWDLVGKAAGLPVWKLLGGAHPRLRAYQSTGELRSPEQRAEDALRSREEGFTAIKLRCRFPTLKEDVAVVRAVREAVGDSMAIMVDANQGWRVDVFDDVRWDFKRALKTARAYEELDLTWLEEPLDQHDYAGYARLRAATTTPIAGGEMLSDLHGFRDHLVAGGLDVVQPDVVFSGGILTSRKIAGMAEAHDVAFAPHTWTNGLGLAANMQVMAAVPNGGWCEYPYDAPGWVPEARDAMLAEPIRVDPDGFITMPDKPGLGIELDWERIEKHGVAL
ncbi:MAG TPA: mandelate racemase/muconate lactonizing enzyme family protein [Acidimicrobiales bacterium]|nr:mandelate racemase/muconate lactonizing enzyme family protein [Acidimicrobiales bacterium]